MSAPLVIVGLDGATLDLIRPWIADGTLPAGYATDDGAGLLYRGTTLVEAVTEIDGKGAYYVESGDGTAIESRLDTRLLR